MKKKYTLDCGYDYDFDVLAINSHTKAYKLCWILNKTLGFNFEIVEDHKINKELVFTRYKSENNDDNQSDGKEDENKQNETQTSLDAGFDLSDQQMDEQLEDSESLKESVESVIQKK